MKSIEGKDDQIKIDGEYYFVTHQQRDSLRTLESSLYGSYSDELFKEFQKELANVKATGIKVDFEADVYDLKPEFYHYRNF